MDNVFRTKKYKDTKPKQQEIGGTLDSIHTNVISTLRSTNIQDLEKRYEEIEEQIAELEDATELTQLIKLTKLKEEHDSLRKSIVNSNAMEDYYLKHADIMLKYYGTQEKTHISTNPADQHTFMRYLVPTSSETAISKKELFDEYTARMKIQKSNTEQVIAPEHCERCNMAREELSAEGVLVCPSCGSEEYMMVVSDFPSFRDPPKERNNYAYKKINHLNEILNQFQAKESTIIPDEVMNEVVCEIKKRRIQNIAEMTEKDMREILKKLNRSKYYEHSAHILSRLNGNPPPTITPEIEEKIRAMFQEIQAPFLLYCPDDRTNFLSYSYILYKFFELLELDEYKAYFSLLKSRDRLIEHDIIWKKICDYLKWEYISSV
jgi:predicted Zn-ribbon and HTH transcriptional regulator